jgi:drug/metabolite transporter (DMT)-like permease
VQALNESDATRPAAAGPETLTLAPRRGFAMGLMVLSSTVISFGGLIIRNMEAADSFQINLYRSLALVVAIGLILVFQYRRRTLSHVRNIGRVGLFGSVMLAVAGIAFVQALTHTTVANALFTLSAIPFITAGLAHLFLKEGLQRATLVTMVVAAFGIFVMMAEGFEIGSAYGNLMALITAVCFSAFAVIVRRKRDIDMVPTLLISGLLIALAAFLARLDDLGITLNDLLLCILWGGLLSGLANWTFIIAARHLVAAEVTLFMLLEFALGPLWVWLFVGEIPTSWTLLGGSLVITAVTVRALIELRRSRRLQHPGGLPSPL